MTEAAAVVTPDAGTLLAQDAKLEPAFIGPRLLRFCLARTRDKDRAQDVASEAILLTLEGEGWHRWTYDGKGSPAESLLIHLVNQAKDVIKKERERASTWHEVHADPGKEPDAVDPASAPGERSPSSEKHMTDMKRAETVMEKLDEDARKVLYVEAESEKDLEPKDVAEKLGMTVKQVHRARERVFYRRDELLAREAKKKGGAS